MRRISTLFVMAVWIAVGMHDAQHALALSLEESRAIAASARSMAYEGKVAEAQALIGRRVTECDSGLGGVPCRALLRFALGNFAEMRAKREPSNRSRWLNEGIKQYETILAEIPDHAPTLRKLADLHVRIGNTRRAEALLERAFKENPEEETVAVMLGDFYMSDQRWEKAVAAYGEAAARNSVAELPRRRMVEAYLKLVPQRMGDLRKLLVELETTFPSVAEFGYRGFIASSYQNIPAIAEDMLVRLVSVLASTRHLTLQNLNELPKGLEPLAVAELTRYIASPEKTPRLKWWQRVDRRNVLADAALALGKQAELTTNPERAAARWEVGLQISPQYDDYAFGRLKGTRMVRLDLQTALALHYFKYPSLDPGKEKFDAVIQDLFKTKKSAYETGDLPTIQRHHTILGTIFAQMKAWRPGRIDGAMFQLEHALKVAAKRDDRDGTFQPLPELRESLADGFAATGTLSRARSIYIDAAQAYLDTDGLRSAQRALQHARGLLPKINDTEKARITQLNAILQTRTAIGRATAIEVNSKSASYAFKAGGPHGRLTDNTHKSVAKDFLMRQRFKAFSDLSERARANGQIKTSEEFALKAFTTAVEGVRHLNGASDIVRIERLRKLTTKQKVVGAKPLRLEKGEKTIAKPMKLWVLTDTPGGRPGYVAVPPDEVLAGKIIGELSGESPEKRVDFRVRDGKVVLPQVQNAEAIKQRIEKIPEVKGVVIDPRVPAKVLRSPVEYPKAPGSLIIIK